MVPKDTTQVGATGVAGVTDRLVTDQAPPSLLTVDEVAAFLRTTREAIFERIKRGQVPGVVRLGRSILVRRTDLRALVGL